MIRLALISSSFHPHTGGVEEHVRHVARALQERGCAVEVWTVDRGEHLGHTLLDGVPVRYLPTPLPARSPGALLRFAAAAPRAWRAWRAAHRAFQPTVLHVQCFGPNGVYALALHHTTGTPLVVSSHGETFMDRAHFDQSWLLRTALARTLRAPSARTLRAARAPGRTTITGCSHAVLADLARFGAGPGTVVPNGVDLHEEERVGAAPPPWEPGPGPVIFSVGRLRHVKGFDLLLAAFAVADLPDARLVIGGTGDELPRLRAQAARLPHPARHAVTFPGELTRAQVIAGMAAATVIVVPSREEAFGIVVLEAWRSGRPLLATARGGPGELITDGVDGVVVDPQDTVAFARALERLVGDPELQARLGRAGRTTVGRFTWDAVAERYLELLRALPPR